MRQNKVDFDYIEASPLEELQFDTIQESQNMPIELIHEEMKKYLKDAPNRKNIQLDKDILQNHKFDVEEPKFNQKYYNLIEYYNQIPKDKFVSQDILELIQDFQPSQKDLIDFCQQNKIEFAQNMLQSNQTFSEVIQINKTNEVYLIHYKLSIISQCFIFIFNGDKFQIEYQFLADFNSKGEQTSIFNKVFINENGIYFLKKNQSVNQIIVNHVKNQKTGFDELKESQKLQKNIKQVKEILKITLDDGTELEHLDFGFAMQVSQEVDVKDMFVVIYQYEYVENKQLLIYSLKNTEQPAITYQNPSIQKIDKAFIVNQNDDISYFILKSRETQIQIKWIGPNQMKIENQSLKENVKSKNISINNRLYDQQIMIEKLKVNLKESDYFDQLYYVDCMGGVDLIFPFQEDENVEKKITEIIQEHHKIEKGFYSWIFAFLSKHGNNYQIKNEDIIQFLEEKGSPQTQNYYPTLRLFLNEMILTLNSSFQSVLHAIILRKDDLLFSPNEQSKLLKSNQYFLYNQINQYSINKNNVYKDMTMIRSKQQVVLNNNTLILKNRKFVVDENNLIIINENNSQPDVLILKLFAPQVECKGSFGQRISEFTKYHFSNNHAIFFFQAGGSGNGQIFFVITSLQELYLLIQQKKYLINEGTDVFIMEKIDQIKKVQFNREDINKGFDIDSIYFNQTQIELLFEANRDLGDPTKDQFPFLLYQQANKKYEVFFCFINLEQAGNQIIHKKKQDKILKIEKYIQSFQIHQHFGWDELTLYKEYDKHRWYYIGYQNKTNMFCRSSNWEYLKDKNQYQAIFQIGFNIQIDNYQAIQVRDHLVQINSDKNVQIKPIKMKIITFNQNYTQDILRVQFDQDFSVNNQRLISKIDDDGNIDGSMLIYNHKKTNQGVWKITNDIELIKKYHSQEVADELADSNFFVTENICNFGQEPTYNGYSFNGTYHEKINKDLLVEQISETAKIYDIINLVDNQQQIYNTIVNNMCKMTIQKNKQLSISTVILNQQCFDSYFEQNQLLYQLFYFQKNLMCTRQIQFNDFSLMNLTQIDQNYLQPCSILGGYNQFHLNKKFIDVSQLKNLISLKQNNDYYLSNSIVEQASQSNNEVFIQKNEINQFYDYQADPFKKVSITQCLIDSKKIIEAVYFFTKTVKSNQSQQTLNMLIQDLPMLMEFQKVDFNEFFNLSQLEESSISDAIDLKNEQLNNIVQCNLEQVIKDNRLKILGSEEQIVYSPNDFKGVQFSKDQMIDILMNVDRPDSEDCQVQYTYISFDEMIRKIQMDLFFNRDTQFCEYLKQFTSLKNIKCSHMILALMINQCREVPNFFEQSTTQNIIDIQFKYTREEIKKYLIIYALGFFIPYVHNSLALIAIENISDESYIHFIFRWSLYLICSMTQIYFLMLEIPEIYNQSFGNYISEIYNFFDISLPILFIVHLTLRAIWMKVTGLGLMQLFDIIVELLIITCSTVKILQYIRYKEEYSYFVQMFFSVLKELGPFLLVFLIFIMVFFVFQIILGAQVPQDGSDYPGAHPYIRMLFHVFRTSVGDLQVLDYSKWADDPTAENTKFSSIVKNIILGLVWTFWIFDIYLILIVMLNLLIAQVGQIYEKIMSQGQTSIYKERAELNQKVFQSKYFYGEKNEFVALIMQTPMQGSDSFNFDDFITFTERVKRTTQVTVDRMENRMKNNIKAIENNVNHMKNTIESKIDLKIGTLESNINLMKDQMGSVQKLMEQLVHDQKILMGKF